MNLRKIYRDAEEFHPIVRFFLLWSILFYSYSILTNLYGFIFSGENSLVLGIIYNVLCLLSSILLLAKRWQGIPLWVVAQLGWFVKGCYSNGLFTIDYLNLILFLTSLAVLFLLLVVRKDGVTTWQVLKGTNGKH